MGEPKREFVCCICGEVVARVTDLKGHYVVVADERKPDETEERVLEIRACSRCAQQVKLLLDEIHRKSGIGFVPAAIQVLRAAWIHGEKDPVAAAVRDFLALVDN